MYPLADVFIICFSVVYKCSLDNIWHNWIPEVKHFCPRTPLVLAGLQADRRGTITNRERGWRGMAEVGVKEAEQMAKNIDKNY